MILLTKFAEQRNEKADTVRKYIRRHEEMFEGHIEVYGHQMKLDEVAVELLEEVYPLPKLVEVVNGVDPLEYAQVLREKSELQSRMEALQTAYAEKLALVARAEATMKLLEDKEQQLRELKTENGMLISENSMLKTENTKANILCESKDKELERLDTEKKELKTELDKYEAFMFGLYRRKKE